MIVLLVVVFLILVMINQYRRSVRLEWSYTKDFYTGFGYLLFYVFCIGFLASRLI